MRNENSLVKIGLILLGIFGLFALFGSFYVINPGERGLIVTTGSLSKNPASEGLSFKLPFFTTVHRVNVRQQTQGMNAPTFSSDLQQVDIQLKVLYRIPESGVVEIFQKYYGNPFDTLIAPRIQEALKEVTASESAEGIVKKRESIKAKTLESARLKIGNLLVIEDIVIEDVGLSNELERAIEQKMVQEQEAAKAKFTKEKARTDAETAEIEAEGQARAINKRGEALRRNPEVIQLMTVEKWNGVSPLVVGDSKGSNVLLPLSKGK